MTALKYITESKICTTAELLNFKREYPKDFDTFARMGKGRNGAQRYRGGHA